MQMRALIPFCMTMVAVLFSSLLLAQAPLRGTRNVESVASISEEELSELILPLPTQATRPFPIDCEWIVTMRVRPHEKPEFWARLKKTYSGRILVEAVAVQKQPIRTQLENMSSSERNEAIASVAARVATRRWKSSEDACAPLVALARDIRRLRTPVIMSDTLVLHRIAYDVVLETRSSRVEYSLSTPLSTTLPHPVAQWTNRVQQVLERCSNSDHE